MKKSSGLSNHPSNNPLNPEIHILGDQQNVSHFLIGCVSAGNPDKRRRGTELIDQFEEIRILAHDNSIYFQCSSKNFSIVSHIEGSMRELTLRRYLQSSD